MWWMRRWNVVECGGGGGMWWSIRLLAHRKPGRQLRWNVYRYTVSDVSEQ